MDVSQNIDDKRLRCGKLLRCGVTTGACAAAAAKAAVSMLLVDAPVDAVTLTTPTGVALSIDIVSIEKANDSVRCAVKKDSGDDPDVTNGVLVYATVKKTARGVCIFGGKGVGRVTKPGLDQPVGQAAINSVPRQMIKEAVQAVCLECGYTGGISVTVSVPQGAALASRTFNPRMGITGGISIIGTTGIVEPMSNRALIDTVRLELKQLFAAGARDVLLSPGNYGAAFCKETLHLSTAMHVCCSNFIGDAIDGAVELGFGRILLVGHIGKLVKLGIGMMNTHSANGDGRMETLVACALAAGADVPLLKNIMECVSTDAALALLYEASLLQDSVAILARRIGDCLIRRVPEHVQIGYVCFTNAEPMAGVLTQSENANDLMALWRE